MSQYIQQNAYLVWGDEFQNLEGQLLTLTDATISDPVQRKAAKDVLRSTLWQWILERKNLRSQGLGSPNFTLTDGLEPTVSTSSTKEKVDLSTRKLVAN